MPISHNIFKLKVKFSAYGLIFFAIVIITSTQLYLHAKNVNATLKNASSMRAQLELVDSVRNETIAIYPLFIDTTATFAKHQELEKKLARLATRAEALPGNLIPATNFSAAALWLHSSDQNTQKKNIGDYKAAILQSYKLFNTGSQTLQMLQQSLQVENNLRRQEAIRLLSTEPYKPFVILLIYLALMAAAGLALYTEVFTPLNRLAIRIQNAAEDAKNARKYILANPRNNEMGSLQKALNSLLQQVEFSLKHADDMAMLSNKRLAAIETAETERQQLQNQMMQSQKIEAIGRLTGGIAHDFNNMLTIIKGNLEIVQNMLGVGHETTKFMKSASRALERSTELTQRLLAFSRTQLLAPQIIDLNKLIPEATMLILRAIGEQVEIVFDFEEDLGNTYIDAGQFENALLNLALNARDAMPAGGQITLKTANVVFDDKIKLHEGDVLPGSYIMVAFIDDGTGIAAEHLGRVFDPFFTTKAIGEGSGLGLSMVFGFVKQSRGHVVIESEVGIGTVIKMYFPHHIGEGGAERLQNADVDDENLPKAANNEAILVVEDEADLLELNAGFLSSLGYQVYRAKNGNEAIVLLARLPRIDLIVTDIVMSGGTTGMDVALKANQINKGIKILLISGYAQNVISDLDKLPPGTKFLAKPYTILQLGKKVRDLLTSVN